MDNNIKKEYFEDSRVKNPYSGGNVNISWTQLRMFYSCPRSFKLKYIDKKSENPINIHLVFGSALHIVLQKYLDTVFNVSATKADELDLETQLGEEMRKEFLNHKKKKHKLEITKEEMNDFYNSGVEIIRYFKRNRSNYKIFSGKQNRLVGIETQLHKKLKDSNSKSLYFLGYIDILIHDENEDIVWLIDIKTSTKGWKDYKKKDKNTTDQIVAYKKYFSEKFNINLDKIKPLFFIFRKEIDQDLMYPPKRTQEFIPSNGTPSVNKIDKKIQKFINYVFDENLKHDTQKPYPAVKGENGWNCTFCEFADKHDLCSPDERLNSIDFNL